MATTSKSLASPTSNINVLRNKKILQYPIGLGSKEFDDYGQQQQYMLFKINTDEKATTLKDDAVVGGVVLAANTREGISVETMLRVSAKNKDPDMRIKYGDKTVDGTRWLTQKGMVRLNKVIVLPMPSEHYVSTAVEYRDDFASGDLTKLGDILNNSAAGVASDLFRMAKNNAVAGLVNKFMAGDKKGNANYEHEKQAANAEDHVATNPKKEVMFDSFSFRKFNFKYDFAPKSEAESDMVRDIIETFRYYALPELNAGKFFYIFPAEFEIAFMQGQLDNPHIPKITTSVLKRVTVNYAPNNVWSTLPNGAPLSLSMNLEFLEMELVDRSRVFNEKSPITSGY